MARGVDSVALVYGRWRRRVHGVSVEYVVSVEYGGCYEAVVALCTKRTIDKEKRLPKDRSPANHTHSLYTTGWD